MESSLVTELLSTSKNGKAQNAANAERITYIADLLVFSNTPVTLPWDV
jgi:hypothetical protein